MGYHTVRTSPPPKSGSSRIAFLLYAALFLAGIVVFYLSITMVDSQSKGNENRIFNDHQYSIAILIREALHHELSHLISLSAALPPRLQRNVHHTPIKNQIDSIFQEFHSNSPHITSLALIDNRKQLIHITANTPREKKNGELAIQTWNANDPLLQVSAGNHQTLPFIEVKNTGMIGLLVPFADITGKIGAIVFAINTDTLFMPYLHSIRSHLKGSALFLTPEGRIIASLNPEDDHKNIFDDPATPPEYLTAFQQARALPSGKQLCPPQMNKTCLLAAWDSIGFGQNRIIIMLTEPHKNIAGLHTSLTFQKTAITIMFAVYLGTIAGLFFRHRARSNALYQKLLLKTHYDASPDGLLVTDEKARPLLWNNRFIEIFRNDGETADHGSAQHILDTMSDRIPPNEHFGRQFNALCVDPHKTLTAETVPLQNGLMLEVFSRVFLAPDDAFHGRIWFFRNITTRETAEAARRESMELLQTVLDNVPSLVYLRDKESRFQLVNRVYEDFFGWPYGKAIGKTPNELHSPELAQQIMSYDKRIFTSHVPIEREETVIINDSSHHMLTREVPIFTSTGAMSALCGISTDITRQKRTEEKLRSAVQEFEAIFDNSQTGVLLLKGERIIVNANPKMAEIFGYSPEELLNSHASILHLNKERSEAFRQKQYSQLAREGLARTEYKMRHKNGHAIWCSLSAKAIAPPDLEQGVIWIIDDISERKQLEELRDSVEHIIRHDLKSPLNTVVYGPQLIRDDNNLTEEQLQLLHEVERAGYQMLDMINKSMDLYRMEQGTYELSPDAVDVAGLIETITRDLAPVCTRKQVQIATSIHDPHEQDTPFIITGEPLLYYSMLSNLIKNAVEASPNDAKVCISLRHEHPQARIVIHNQGVVPERIHRTFFEKFATADKSGGTGLGTYSARLIAEAHGGTISMTSSAETGTKITILLPATIDETASQE